MASIGVLPQQCAVAIQQPREFCGLRATSQNQLSSLRSHNIIAVFRGACFPAVNAPCRHGLRTVTCAAQGGGGGGIGGFFGKLKASLPVVGLVSRLVSAEDAVGDDFITYTTYCRGMYDKSTGGIYSKIANLQDEFGKNNADSRHVLFCCWLGYLGAGAVPRDVIMRAVKNLRVSKDLGYLVESFDAELEQAYQKDSVKKRSQTLSDSKRLDVMVEALVRYLGPPPLDKYALTQAQEAAVASLLAVVMPGMPVAEIEASFGRIKGVFEEASKATGAATASALAPAPTEASAKAAPTAEPSAEAKKKAAPDS